MINLDTIVLDVADYIVHVVVCEVVLINHQLVRCMFSRHLRNSKQCVSSSC